MSFKNEIEKKTREEVLEEVIKLASYRIEEYDGDDDWEAIEKMIREKLECPVCGRLDRENHDELAHKANDSYTGIG